MGKNKDTATIKNTYLIAIDRELIHEYHQYYMKQHPSARSYPFAKKRNIKLFNKDGSPQLTSGGKQKTKKIAVTKKDYTIDDCIYGILSLNELLIIQNRMTMNQLKDHWCDLGIWIAKKYNLNNLNIQNCMIEFRIFSETLAKKDNDNISGGIKFLCDGFLTKSGLCADDNYFIVNPLLINCHYDNTHPRTEIRISTFDNSIKDVYEKLKIHIKNFKELN